MSITCSDPHVPRHLAIVMDGNGRWAEKHHRPRTFGHSSGQKAVREAIKFCLRTGIGSLTLFAFSSENWRRPQGEVRSLMQLFMKALDRETEQLHKQHVRIEFIGDLSAFDDILCKRMRAAMQRTRGNTALRLNVAVNYGGRWDIAHAARKLAIAVSRGELAPEQIDETQLGTHLCLADQPSPDLLIRTGGDLRISNFLLWQLAYAEFYFTDTLWPDIDTECLARALENYASRQRRFGQTGAQIAAAGA